jgi:hypothetical protein
MKEKNTGLNTYQHSIPHRIIILFDAFAIVATFLFAYYLRYSFNFDSFVFVLALKQSFFALMVYLVFELLLISFAGHAIRTTIQNILRVLVSTTCSVVILMLFTFLSSQLGWQIDLLNIPRSILLIHYISVFILCSVLRIVFQLLVRTK